MPDPRFPGRSLRAGEPNAPLVKAVQRRLNAGGCGPIAVDGAWGAATTAAVRLFQARFTAPNGTPLKVDGVVGPITWGALFPEAVEPARPATGLAERALAVAAAEVGVKEDPPGSNRGPRVAEYLASVGLAIRRRPRPFVRTQGEAGALRTREPPGCPRASARRANGRWTAFGGPFGFAPSL